MVVGDGRHEGVAGVHTEIQEGEYSLFEEKELMVVVSLHLLVSDRTRLDL